MRFNVLPLLSGWENRDGNAGKSSSSPKADAFLQLLVLGWRQGLVPRPAGCAGHRSLRSLMRGSDSDLPGCCGWSVASGDSCVQPPAAAAGSWTPVNKPESDCPNHVRLWKEMMIRKESNRQFYYPFIKTFKNLCFCTSTSFFHRHWWRSEMLINCFWHLGIARETEARKYMKENRTVN